MSFVLQAMAPNLGRIVDDVNSGSTNGGRIDTKIDGMNSKPSPALVVAPAALTFASCVRADPEAR
jgi:hypothetical protein